MIVKEIMTKNVITCQPHSSIREAARLMYLNGLTGLPVLDVNDEVVGIITEQDLVKLEQPIHIPSIVGILGSALYLDNPLNGDEIEKQLEVLSATTVEQIMTQKVVTIAPDASLEDLAELFLSKKINPIPVVETGKLVGIVSRADIVKMLAGDKDLGKAEWGLVKK